MIAEKEREREILKKDKDPCDDSENIAAAEAAPAIFFQLGGCQQKGLMPKRSLVLNFSPFCCYMQQIRRMEKRISWDEKLKGENAATKNKRNEVKRRRLRSSP